MKRQHCAYHDGEKVCSRSVGADWICIVCALPVCQWHCQSITFATGKMAGSSALCYTCMQRLIPTLDDELGRARIGRAYQQMLRQAIGQQFEHNLEETRATLAKLEAEHSIDAGRIRKMLRRMEDMQASSQDV